MTGFSKRLFISYSFLLFLLILITCLSVFLIATTGLQISAIKYGLNQIIDIDESTAKLDDLTKSFESLSETIKSDVGNYTHSFDKLNADLVKFGSAINSKLGSLEDSVKKTRSIIGDENNYLYWREAATVIMCLQGSKTLDDFLSNNSAEFLSDKLADELDQATDSMQQKLLPLRATLLTGPDFQLESWFKYRKAVRIQGGEYLTTRLTDQNDYFPETPNLGDFTNVKTATFPAVHGQLLTGSGSTSVAAIKTQVTVPSNGQFTLNLSYFIVYAHEIIPPS